MWTTKDSNLTSQTEHTTLSDRTIIDLWGSIFTRPISKETGRNLVQTILDCHPSICQNNPSLSQDNIANSTQSSLLNETPLNNPLSLNLDPEPLPLTQNQNKTASLLSNNPKHNNRPLNNTSTVRGHLHFHPWTAWQHSGATLACLLVILKHTSLALILLTLILRDVYNVKDPSRSLM